MTHDLIVVTSMLNPQLNDHTDKHSKSLTEVEVGASKKKIIKEIMLMIL